MIIRFGFPTVITEFAYFLLYLLYCTYWYCGFSTKKCSDRQLSAQFTCKEAFGTDSGGTALTQKFVCSSTKTDYTTEAVCYREWYLIRFIREVANQHPIMKIELHILLQIINPFVAIRTLDVHYWIVNE